jgi:sec-independent protein translocase protein TatA
MGMPGGIEWAIIAVIVILIFGGKKIPELAKGIGKGIKDFKKAVKDDDETTEVASADEPKKVEKNESKEAESKPSETTKQA